MTRGLMRKADFVHPPCDETCRPRWLDCPVSLSKLKYTATEINISRLIQTLSTQLANSNIPPCPLVEDPASRTKRLRPLQYPIYVNIGGDADTGYDRTKTYGEVKPLRALDQNLPDNELPDCLVVRTRRRTMSGVTGQLPRSTTLSSSSIWFGDHPVPTKTQINAAESSPLRLSNIQLQAQAEIARRRSRNNLASSRSVSGAALSRSRSLDRSLVMAPSASSLYGPTGRRVRGGAPLVERAIKRHMSKRDGYETLSVINVPRLEKPGSATEGQRITPKHQKNLHQQRPMSSASMYRQPASVTTAPTERRGE